MHKTETLKQNTKNSAGYLELVASSSVSRGLENLPNAQRPTPNAQRQKVEPKTTRYLTWALMNRLWIPQSHSIVGLLEVGITKDNFDEISKWVSKQLEDFTTEPADSMLSKLEQNFRNTVIRFPEM